MGNIMFGNFGPILLQFGVQNPQIDVRPSSQATVEGFDAERFCNKTISQNRSLFFKTQNTNAHSGRHTSREQGLQLTHKAPAL